MFWHNGGIVIDPECEQERNILVELIKNIKLEKLEGTQDRIPSGSAASGSDELFECIRIHHKARPSSLTSETSDK
jgi:hypothetical protein